uniref:C2 domain-containing protein n=1 Tax=Syphacia muris TaxID=451379 RepID=A0A0N5ASW7_9BILA
MHKDDENDFVSYVIVKLHSVASGTPLVKGNQPYYDQEFVFETNNLKGGILIELWAKGVLWDTLLGARYLPLSSVEYEPKPGNFKWLQLDATKVEHNGEVIGTSGVSLHSLLADIRFENLDLQGDEGKEFQAKLHAINECGELPCIHVAGISEDSDYTSDVSFPVHHQANASVRQWDGHLQARRHSRQSDRSHEKLETPQNEESFEEERNNVYEENEEHENDKYPYGEYNEDEQLLDVYSGSAYDEKVEHEFEHEHDQYDEDYNVQQCNDDDEDENVAEASDHDEDFNNYNYHNNLASSDMEHQAYTSDDSEQQGYNYSYGDHNDNQEPCASSANETANSTGESCVERSDLSPGWRRYSRRSLKRTDTFEEPRAFEYDDIDRISEEGEEPLSYNSRPPRRDSIDRSRSASPDRLSANLGCNESGAESPKIVEVELHSEEDDEAAEESEKHKRDYKALWKWAYEEVCRVHSIRRKWCRRMFFPGYLSYDDCNVRCCVVEEVTNKVSIFSLKSIVKQLNEEGGVLGEEFS